MVRTELCTWSSPNQRSESQDSSSKKEPSQKKRQQHKQINLPNTLGPCGYTLPDVKRKEKGPSPVHGRCSVRESSAEEVMFKQDFG